MSVSQREVSQSTAMTVGDYVTLGGICVGVLWKMGDMAVGMPATGERTRRGGVPGRKL